MIRYALPRSLGLLIVAAYAAQAAWAALPPIAFAVEGGGDGRASRIYVANPDGTEPRPLNAGTGRERSPAFSPDGRWLAYQSTNELGLDTILVQPVDGGPARQVGQGAYPQWSQDGRRLLVSRRLLNEYNLFVVPVEGRPDPNQKPLTKGQIGRWSPDEKRLAAVVPVILEGQDRWQIQIMPVDTLQPSFRLTLPESYGQVVSLDWSPNGESLAFSTTRQGRYDLYVVDPQMPEPRRIPKVEPGAAEVAPNPAFGSWSPDGTRILFRSAADGSGAARLFSVNAEGTDIRLVWEPADRSLRIQGTAWARPLPAVAVKPAEPMPAPMPPAAEPRPAVPPVKPPDMPKPAPAPRRVLGPSRKAHAAKVFTIDLKRSPASVRLAAPGADDWLVNIPVLPQRRWVPRRQGVGVTVELENGGLYRGNIIYSQGVWATIQGRPKQGSVRLIDGKQLPAGGPGFRTGFQLTVRREGPEFIVNANGQDIVRRAVLTSPVKRLSLTLENFDPGSARFPLGNIYYRQATEAPAGTE